MSSREPRRHASGAMYRLPQTPKRDGRTLEEIHGETDALGVVRVGIDVGQSMDFAAIVAALRSQ